MHLAQPCETGIGGILDVIIIQAFEANSDPCIFCIQIKQKPQAKSQNKVTCESLPKRSEIAILCDLTHDLGEMRSRYHQQRDRGREGVHQAEPRADHGVEGERNVNVWQGRTTRAWREGQGRATCSWQLCE